MSTLFGGTGVNPFAPVGKTAGNRLFVALMASGPFCSFGQGMNIRHHGRTFMSYLSHLNIDLTLFVPFSESEAKRFLYPHRNFVFAHRMMYSDSRAFDHRYEMECIVDMEGGRLDRLLFITSEVEKRIHITNSIVCQRSDVTKHTIEAKHSTDHSDYAMFKNLCAPEHKGKMIGPRDDFLCLALADIIHDLVKMEELDVKDYIEMCPLLERVDAPMMSHVNFLPILNCLPYGDRVEEFRDFARYGPKNLRGESQKLLTVDTSDGAGADIVSPSLRLDAAKRASPSAPTADPPAEEEDNGPIVLPEGMVDSGALKRAERAKREEATKSRDSK